MHFRQWKRREFITLLGGAAVARRLAGQRSKHTGARIPPPHLAHSNADLRGFHHGLKEAGYVDGENAAILYRWAENHIDRLLELAADLVYRRAGCNLPH
jgi:putative ABC transport system substrate-binding protein